jgi:hypothetical protein
MATREITVRVTRQQIIDTLYSIVSGLAGRTELPERQRINRLLAMQVLSIIKEAYVIKSRGGTDAAGEWWPDISEITKRIKKSDLILIDKSRLIASLSPIEGSIPDGQVLNHRPDGFDVGTNIKSEKGVPYPYLHHEGKGGMKKRRLWPEPADWPAEWNKLMIDQLRDAIIAVMVERLVQGVENN